MPGELLKEFGVTVRDTTGLVQVLQLCWSATIVQEPYTIAEMYGKQITHDIPMIHTLAHLGMSTEPTTRKAPEIRRISQEKVGGSVGRTHFYFIPHSAPGQILVSQLTSLGLKTF